ncbi:MULTISPECIES: HigA family addiction module antitoxin [Pantoea]|jgi:addiction module HigA family antidote|uniref:HigA family addiction module antitoxin n=1 Tax=Pantoea TaxID=53335 RepID=UPI0010C9AB34|nr:MULTISPECIES: HigA family addiction module antitoxin [Pantoea]MBD9644935.1 HigA family addiction module antidote protein [Pantoea sp. PNT02]MDR6350752.1 addiction module HigA family antidote [Pantoea sp. SORGH_AS_0659]QCP59367.1 HigA family addiction module antidote protein [Pantoea sp. SO10]WFL69010.1 HigA family addiction module antitoxin [Pantoea sp. X85]WGK58761.1 HigA family addiction module antitoxin [Pantoea sp. SS70]
MAMFNPPHPGGLITEYIEDNNIGLRVLAKELGVSASALSKVASGKASVSPEMAVRLEAGLGIAARLWLSMQAACDLHKARETTDVSGVNLHPGMNAASEAHRAAK